MTSCRLALDELHGSEGRWHLPGPRKNRGSLLLPRVEVADVLGYVAPPTALLTLAVWQSGNGAMQARPTRPRPVAREPRAVAAPASVGPASEGGERS